jgi:cytoskeleton protein RodZ
MASFGENLRREREMRGVGLEEISSATKISVRLLEALEAEDFPKLPGGIFTRSFIRAYAKYLGLDEERILAEYQLAAPPTADVDDKRPVTPRPVGSGGNLRGRIIAVTAAVVVIAWAYVLFHQAHGKPRPSATPQSPASTDASPPPTAPKQTTAGNPVATSPVGLVGPGSTNSTALASPENPGGSNAGTSSSSQRRSSPQADDTNGLVLQVAATEKAWVAIDADGKTAQQRVFAPHDIETFKAKDYFDVTTGNAQGTLLTLNGETLKPLGRHGEYKKLHLTRDDIKNSAP